MKIWLDDCRDPTQEHIKMKFGSVGDEVWCKHCWDARGLLETGKVTDISFDHDLGVSRITGYDLALLIERWAFQGRLPPLRWRIHSQNPVGAANIAAAMKNADKYWKERGLK